MIVEIRPDKKQDIQILENFLKTLGNSSLSFRYFQSRPISVLSNHLITVILLDKNQPIGYGHLDRQDDDVWLGIAIAESFTGMGNGKLVMDYLVNAILRLKLPRVKLSVDIDNANAIRLYKKYGFEVVEEKGKTLFLQKLTA